MKRRFGLFKKAHELAVLTDSNITVLISSWQGKNYQFSSHPINDNMARYERIIQRHGVEEHRTAADFASERAVPQNPPSQDPDIPVIFAANAPLTPRSKMRLDQAYSRAQASGESMPSVQLARTPKSAPIPPPSVQATAPAPRSAEPMTAVKRKAPTINIPAQPPQQPAYHPIYAMPSSTIGQMGQMGQLGRQMSGSFMYGGPPLMSPAGVSWQMTSINAPPMAEQSAPTPVFGMMSFPIQGLTPVGYGPAPQFMPSPVAPRGANGRAQ
ncbi:SRF-type transcription factor (DNA-binding and dimerization domain) [Carpediemonas membranifera]|uniref:SRF-type transcription factor (DNA-binding and dimerization domain) n=1 Tax=Carpediemonas membranifera TaxID=201153 RepID=A0A8J6B112_9EUKA|nr:SRF-type transcription factor (DNA-binding and dimerization domain) [Carpediemonas membranifera]|eukprot:KAG9393318.1 SRF-type transcription factor (DNA-binding and dimerization domain) [Carpediemonas membranifera]